MRHQSGDGEGLAQQFDALRRRLHAVASDAEGERAWHASTRDELASLSARIQELGTECADQIDVLAHSIDAQHSIEAQAAPLPPAS